MIQSKTKVSTLTKHSSNTSTGLEKFRDMITNYAPQDLLLHRAEETKVEYLQNALGGIIWAITALTQCYTQSPPRTFHQLNTAFDFSRLQEKRTNKKNLFVETSTSVFC